MSIEIESSDVINLIEQFLEENKLSNTLDALRNETGLTLNSHPNVDSLIENIHQGHWDVVLGVLKNFKISQKTLINLYEQIVFELLEMREISAARSILRMTDCMDLMKKSMQDRYLKLENILSKTYFDPKEIYQEGSSKEKRRKFIAQEIKKEVVEIPSSRLLILLGQALKYQQSQGLIPPEAKIDLLTGRVVIKDLTVETFPTTLSLSIQFASPTFAKAVAFSPDGQYLVSGSSDGFIEIWNFMTGKLRTDLKYQETENYMIMNNSITSLAFSCDSEILGSGDSSGTVKLWKIRTGECFRQIEAHNQSVSCILFTTENLFTSSTDCLIRQLSFKSGGILKQYSGHEAFVNNIICQNKNLISVSTDGTIRIWSIKTTECLKILKISHGPSLVNLAIMNIFIHPNIPESYMVCNRSSNLYSLNKNGQIIKIYENGRKDDDGDFMSAVLSPKGNYIYAFTQDGNMFCLDIKEAKFINTIKVHETNVLSHSHHPNLNLIATCSADGSINIWK